jgi:hypothetical protein
MIASQLYLIAHKVRGEPAFDVACKMEMPDGDWWIIPTSGHRAYPFWHQELLDIWPEMPADLPDHYPKSDYTNRSTSPALHTPRLEDI